MSAVPINRARPLPPDLAKTLPNSIEAERSILGAILLDNAALAKVVHMAISALDFFYDHHGRIYLAMLQLAADKVAIDLITLTEKLHSESRLEQSGGGAYLASLADGMPRVSNVEHYGNIVKEKYRLRQIIHHTYNIQQKAFENDSKADDLCNDLETFSRTTVTVRDNPAVIVGWHELLTLDMPEPKFIINPLLTVGGSMMIYSWAGVGKSYVTTDMAAHIALGESKVFCWPITEKFRVLYIYGEMHGGEIKKRWREIANGHKVSIPEGDDSFGFMSKEYQRIKRAQRSAFDWRPSIFSPTDRRIIEDRVAAGGYQVLVLDNISTLWPSSQEASSDREAVLKNWFIDLNQNGVSVIALTHAGKGGDFLGDSSQIHILDSVVRLRRPSDYSRDQQLRAEVKIEKLRHECKDYRLLQEFEISLETSAELGAVWLTRPMKDVQRKTVFGMFVDGMSRMDVTRAMAGDPSMRTIYRWHQDWQKNPDPNAWIEK